jgi:hypothetical protein
MLPATMDISARATSLAARPRLGHWGHQCSHAPGRPILHLFVASRRPRRVSGLRHRGFLILLFLCLCQGCSFVPTCTTSIASRAGAVKVGRRADRTVRAAVARPRLDGPEHGAEDQADRTPTSFVLLISKSRPLASTAQAMRASLLASAIASTLWCSRFLAASIQDLRPWRSQL